MRSHRFTSPIVRDAYYAARRAAREAREAAGGRDSRGGRGGYERDSRGGSTLADVLVVGTLLVEVHAEPKALEAQINCAKPLQRLQLDYAACQAFLKESAKEIAALRDALG